MTVRQVQQSVTYSEPVGGHPSRGHLKSLPCADTGLSCETPPTHPRVFITHPPSQVNVQITQTTRHYSKQLSVLGFSPLSSVSTEAFEDKIVIRQSDIEQLVKTDSVEEGVSE